MSRQPASSHRSKRYLGRRHRLFRTLSQKLWADSHTEDHAQIEKSRDPTDNSHCLSEIGGSGQQQAIKNKPNAASLHAEFLQLCELLDSENSSSKLLRDQIQSLQFIDSYAKTLVNHTFLWMVSSDSTWAVSNFVYLVCTRSSTFRQELQKYVLTNYCSEKFSGNLTFKQLQFFTDVYLFGIYLTQSQMMGYIQSSFMNLIAQPAPEHSECFFRYFNSYLQVFLHPSVLTARNHQRLHQVFCEYLFSVVFRELSCLYHEKYLHQLNLLRISYTENPSSCKQIENQYLVTYKYLFNYQKWLIRMFIAVLRLNRQEYNEAVSKFIKEILVLSMHLPIDLTQIQSGYLERSCLELKDDRQLLLDIEYQCRYYRNKKYYIQEDVYMLSSVPLTDPRSHLPYEELTPIPVLAEDYLERLCNCSSIESATLLANQFLSEGNKHENRQKLVGSVFKKMGMRNNLALIVRVLAEISRCEPEISQFVNLKINEIRSKQSSSKENQRPFPPKYFKQHSALILELIKFDLHSPQPYLQDLLTQIQSLQLPNPQHSPSSSTSENALLTPNIGSACIVDIAEILSKMDRIIYYKDLPTHLMLNGIIEFVYDGIKNSCIAYDSEIVDRFNSIVMYLRSSSELQAGAWVALENSNSQNLVADLIEVDQIRDENEAIKLARELSTTIKSSQERQKETSRLVSKIEKSIEYNGFLSSYYFADLVYKMNMQSIDKAVASLAESRILCKLAKKQDYQGAVNWARFLGQLYSCEVITQRQLLDFLQQSVFDLHFEGQTRAGAIKVICSALETCKNALVSTKSRREISGSLLFLLRIKKQLLKVNGLANAILEHEIVDIIDFFHPLFQTFNCVESIEQFEKTLRHDIEIESKLNQTYQKILSSASQKYREVKPNHPITHSPKSTESESPNSPQKIDEKTMRKMRVLARNSAKTRIVKEILVQSQ